MMDRKVKRDFLIRMIWYRPEAHHKDNGQIIAPT